MSFPFSFPEYSPLAPHINRLGERCDELFAACEMSYESLGDAPTQEQIREARQIGHEHSAACRAMQVAYHYSRDWWKGDVA